MHAMKEWLLAGSPRNGYLLLAAAYALGCWLLSKSKRFRANTVGEALMNALNPRVLPLLKLIPIAGPVLGALLEQLDTPPAAPAVERKDLP